MKLRQATAEANIVTIGDNSTDDIPINGEGLGVSNGFALYDEGVVVYLPDTQPDLKDTLEKLIDLTTELINSIGVVPVSALGAPLDPSFVPKGNQLIIELETIKGALK